jgi:hypothetical protein
MRIVTAIASTTSGIFIKSIESILYGKKKPHLTIESKQTNHHLGCIRTLRITTHLFTCALVLAPPLVVLQSSLLVRASFLFPVLFLINFFAIS